MLDQARTIAANKGASVEVEAAREGAEFTF
jgi:hypothetical protein